MNAIAIVLVAAFFGLPQLGQHPVPLPAKFDPAKCVECHSDKQQGKYVHTAMAGGCTTCHTINTKDGATTIGLVAPPEQLCVTCHPLSTGVSVHPPYAEKQCVVCHSPHSSNFVAHTRAGTNALCLACHGERKEEGTSVEVFEGQKIPMGEYASAPKIQLDPSGRVGHPFMGHPVAGMPDPLRKGEALSCLSCHEHHTASIPPLLQASWKSVTICDQCHQAAKAAQSTKPKGPKP